MGLLLVVAFGIPAAHGQVSVGNDLRMNANGTLTAGYSAVYGDEVPSSHGLNFGGQGQLAGSYFDPNFLNFTFTPYFNQSRANSSFQSLTNSSGLTANVNLFGGSRFPGFVSYQYSHDSTGTLGLVGSPNFTTIGNGQGFGVGWSALIPDLPTLSASYSQGTGTGTIYGTNQLSSSTNRTINVRSTYYTGGWNLNAFYTHLSLDSTFPTFLSGEQSNTFSNFGGNSVGVNGSRKLPWNGTVALTYNHATYGGDTGETVTQNKEFSNYTTDTETAVVTFHPTQKWTLFGDQQYTNNLNGAFYQNLLNSGSVPLLPINSQSNSSTVSGGTTYNFSNSLFAQGQITYYDQSYFGQSYEGSYVSGTLGYGKRILHLFSISATVIESSNKFTNNALGFIGNLNYFHRFGLWETSGSFSYAQNVQTVLVTYTNSYYNYSGNVHRKLGRGTQWTASYNGSHSGLTNQAGTVNSSNGGSTSLALRDVSLSANYVKSSGNSVLTSTGIQPIAPTPGLPPAGIIVYNGKSYGGNITVTPMARLSLSGTYSHAVSDTLSSSILSNNRTEIFYGQLQYRLRRITLLGGFTKFSQGISAAGVSPGNQYSYFVGVTRWLNFF